MEDFERQHQQAQWCRQRAERHRSLAASLPHGHKNRRHHERECTSWTQEAMFYEAMRDRLIQRRLDRVAAV